MPGVSSLKHLLVKPILRATVWMVAAVTCVGNGMVLWGRFSSRDENKVHSLVIRNLAGKLVVINVACKRRPFRGKIEVYVSGDEFLHL